jgi:hypothetical protein
MTSIKAVAMTIQTLEAPFHHPKRKFGSRAYKEMPK